MRTAEKCCVLQQLATAPNRDENYRVCAQGHRLFRHGKCCTVRLDGVKEKKKVLCMTQLFAISLLSREMSLNVSLFNTELFSAQKPGFGVLTIHR